MENDFHMPRMCPDKLYISFSDFGLGGGGGGWRQRGSGVDRRFPDSVANSWQMFPASPGGEKFGR
jgi:hypothetical protein